MAAKCYDACLNFVFQYEGGYVNDPRDPGGPTNRGITIATLSHELGRQATIADVKTLSREKAASIYRKKYWNAIGGDLLAPGVDLLAFDICVNSGVGRANDWLQQSSRLFPGDRIRWLDAKRRSFWKSLKTWAVYGKGWSRREDAAFALALKLQGAK